MARVFYLDQDFADLLIEVLAAAADEGIFVQLVSAWRDPRQQRVLFKRFGRGRVARPGFSFHEYGFAVDVSASPGGQLRPSAQLNRLGQIAEDFGLRWGGRFKALREPWHLDAGKQISISKARQLYQAGAYLVEVA